ncbi:MAG: sensor histidine kinase [Solirubrobacteraceae bacterium]|nr:sensor histidine kinase [Solirubrobacteraceae bacterium]
MARPTEEQIPSPTAEQPLGAAQARGVRAERLLEAGQSLASAEAERSRWARELHDDTLQGLAAVKLALTAARRAEPGAMGAGIERAIGLTDDGIRGLRDIIADLRPAALDELGLGPALRALVERVRVHGDLTLELELELGDARVPATLETVAYRVVQEALANVVKHARATNGRVSAAVQDGDLLRIEVADNGDGLGETPGNGFGLIGMRERAVLAGGSLDVRDGDTGGTVVDLQLPLA